ncbi:MAG: mechanosensitive ion channel family protein [Thaumarchaeota archaeon]|nr:mechanosensitive ion channel family protein [Nitrososphaerota archaeon]
MPFDYIPVAISLAITLVACIILFIFGRKVVPKLAIHDSVRVTLRKIITSPVIAAVAGYGLLISWEFILSSITTPVPIFLQTAEVQLIVQLIILAVSMRTIGSIVSEVVPPLVKAPEADKILVYSIYTVGLIVLGYVALTSPVSPRVATNIWAVINFVTGVFMTYLAVYVVNVVFKRYSAEIEGKETGLKTTVTFIRRLVLSVVALIGVAVATFASFPTVGAAIASIFLAAGFASIVIGLAAQTSLSNLIAGMVIATSQPFKIGDALSYANEWAWVEDIKLTFTVLRTWDNRRLVVPNQMFLSTTMINYDAVDSTKLCIVYVTITFESDLDKAIEILKDVARKHPDFLPSGNLPVVHVMDLGDANGTSPDANVSPGISLRLLSRAKDQPTNFQMSKDILYALKKAFDESGIEIAYPRRQIVIDPQPRKTAKTLNSVGDESQTRKQTGFEKNLNPQSTDT